VAHTSHDVRKDPIDPKGTLAALAKVKTFYIKSGKSVKVVDRKKDQPTDKEILKQFLGRSGTMRAPVLVNGSKAMAGFEEETYRMILGV
jgi:arsenate reductase-like glutaredoxin family protein